MDTRSSKSESWAVRAAVAAVLGSALLIPSLAFSAEAKNDKDDEELAEVTVTGTRIQVPGNYTSPNPINSITGEEMRNLGIVNVADALLQLVPQNISTYTPFLAGDDQQEVGGTFSPMDRSSFFIGNTIANLRGLDPSFGSRTLTMVDGRRVVSTSNQADVVDMNIIPSNLLQRMDVVTGGASATYGSGAMAGVVNLVLNNRLTGFNLDMDYGVNEAGDGGSPHISASGGMPLFGGKGHILLGVEWQDQSAIRDCAAARDWCRESRFMFTNSSGSQQNVSAVNASLPGFENFPARFEMENVRYSQFAPTGTILHNSTNNTVGYRFTANGTGIEEYAYGYRGGSGGFSSATSGWAPNVMNGDGPLVTSGTVMRPSSSRKTLFSNFEYNITERTTGYVQANYAKTDGLNKNRYTGGAYCVRFDAAGTQGTNADAQSVWTFGTAVGGTVDGQPYAPVRTSQIATITEPVRVFLGLSSTLTSYISGGVNPYGVNGGAATRGLAFPFWVPISLSPNGPPTFDFGGNAVGHWVRFKFNVFDAATYVTGSSTNFYTPFFPVNDFWVLDTITLTTAFDSGTPTVLPARGRNEYAFLNQLDPEALNQLQRGFSNSITTGGGIATGIDSLWGTNACNGFTAIRKVWNPQLERYTSQESETMRVVAGVKGRFGRDWRWDAYYQYGQTDSKSEQNNVATTVRLAMAVDAVIDDRATVNGAANPTFGKPVCRITRDGIPVLDTVGRPLSDPAGLQALTDGCQPINLFGTTFATPEDALRQQQAIDFAFVESVSKGQNSLQTLSLNLNGTLWQGFGAGPMTSAFSLEMRRDSVDNAGTEGPYYLRSDLASSWSDAFGGSTTTTEGSIELNLPLVSGQPGINLWSANGAIRYANYLNKGGVGTTGQKANQHTTNWKFSTVFEPFDWVRFRLTRSRDLRAAGYRDLFAQQPGIPDQLNGINPWRERTAASTENQQDRWGQVGVGNPLLKPETSDTLTLGLVLSPSGWAQGMRMSVDYYNIKVKDGITIPFSAETPLTACWEGSGNRADQYVDGEIVLGPDGQPLGRNGLFDESVAACREIQFAANEDGSRNLQDVIAYNSRRPQNSLPFQRRGLDLAWNYMFPLSRAFESLPGSVSMRVSATRALESSGIQLAAFPSNVQTYFDLTGQIRSSVFIPGVAASPNWTGSVQGTYILGDLTTTLSARYIGGAKLDKSWCDSNVDCATYQDALGQFLNGSVDNNEVKSYVNFSLNGSYNLKIANMKQFQVFGSVNNLFDKTPPFTGGGISGASAQYHDTMGRAYRMGVRMRF